MAPPPRIRTLSVEDYPGIPKEMEPLFGVLNDALTSIADALTKRLTLSENLQAGEAMDKEFKTADPVASTSPVLVKWVLPTTPRHLSITRMRTSDDVALTAAWSYSWDLQDPNLFAIRFQGLTASTSYKFNCLYW